MQEVYQHGMGIISYLGCDFCWTSLKKKRQHEVGIAIHKSLDRQYLTTVKKPMVSDIVVHGFKIQMISTEENVVFKTDHFYRRLS